MKRVHGWAYPADDELMARDMRSDGSYQADHLTRALGFVTDWSRAIDGGAHVGTWAARMAGFFDEVIAVEPAPDTFAALVENMATFKRPNVLCRQVALGAALGAVGLGLDPKDVARKNTGGRFVTTDGPIARVTVDEWGLEALGFLKLDVEGSEPLALAGAKETLARCRPVVLFEDKGLCQRYGFPSNASEVFLAGEGYRMLARVGCDQIWGYAA